MPKDRNGYVKRFNLQKDHKDFGKTANYDWKVQNEPPTRMGSEDFANMPAAPMIKSFSKSHNYRSGVVNDFTCALEDESGIHENKIHR